MSTRGSVSALQARRPLFQKAVEVCPLARMGSTRYFPRDPQNQRFSRKLGKDHERLMQSLQHPLPGPKPVTFYELSERKGR